MPLFSSTRERRLWLWALVIVVAIYASLGLAPVLAGVLRERGLLVVAFIVALLLVVATVVAQAFRVRAGGLEIAVGLGIAAAYLLAFVRISLPEERTHLIEYGVLAVFLYEALAERALQGRRVPPPAVVAILATAALGVVDEVLQAALPNRIFDPVDMLFNLLAAGMAVVATVALRWAHRRTIRMRAVRTGESLAGD